MSVTAFRVPSYSSEYYIRLRDEALVLRTSLQQTSEQLVGVGNRLAGVIEMNKVLSQQLEMAYADMQTLETKLQSVTAKLDAYETNKHRNNGSWKNNTEIHTGDAWTQINWKLDRELHEERIQNAILENELRSVRDKLRQAEKTACEHTGRVAMIADKNQPPAVSTAPTANAKAKGLGENNHQQLMMQQQWDLLERRLENNQQFEELLKQKDAELTQWAAELDRKQKTLRPLAPPAAPKSRVGTKRQRSPEITTVPSHNPVPKKKAKHRADAGFDRRRAL
jgi:hypothetical protein